MKNTVLLLITSVGLISAAHAGPGRGPVDLEQLAERHAERVAAMDTNQDGVIDPTEFTAAKAPQRRGMKRRPGRSHRGHNLSAEDRAEMQSAVFDELDTDSDGQISRTEFSGEKLRAARKTARRARMFARLDENGDGLLQADELPNPAERLGALDTDGDGQISREERRAARAARRAEQG